MLTLYNRYNLPKDKEDIKFPWNTYFCNNKITNYFDETDEKIVKDIEKASLSENDKTHPIILGNLSDGCKTLLAINHTIKNNTTNKYIFNISDCGGNMIAYLASEMTKDKDVYAYVEHFYLGSSNNCNIRIEHKTFKNTIEAANELIKLQERNINHRLRLSKAYEIQAKSSDYEIDLHLRSSRTIISGNSGSGRTLLFNTLCKSKIDKDIVMINYKWASAAGNYRMWIDTIRNSENTIFIIDQFDSIQRLNNEISEVIDSDFCNNFILIGRHPELRFSQSDICHVNIENNKITLKYDLDEPAIQRW